MSSYPVLSVGRSNGLVVWPLAVAQCDCCLPSASTVYYVLTTYVVALQRPSLYVADDRVCWTLCRCLTPRSQLMWL